VDDFSIRVTRVDTDSYPLVQAHVSVFRPDGSPAAGLTKEQFSLAEDSAPILSFDLEYQTDQSAPVTFAVAIDSAALKDKARSALATDLAQWVDTLRPQDALLLVSLNPEARVLLPASTDRAKIQEALKTLPAEGPAVLWDGVQLAVQSLTEPPAGRAVLIVVSSAVDSGSSAQPAAVIGAAAAQGLPVFPIGFGAADRTALTQLAAQTGGQAFFAADSSGLIDPLKRIFQQVLPEYVVSYSTKAPQDGARRQLGVQVQVNGQTGAGSAFYTAPDAPLTVSMPGLKENEPVAVGLPRRLTPQFSAQAEIVKVEYYLNGAFLAVVDAAPFEWTWTPQAADLGGRTLNVRAYTRKGEKAECFLPLQVVAPIQLQILQPATDAHITGPVQIQASATGAAEMARVVFLIDDQTIATVEKPPYTALWNAPAAKPGPHVLKVQAFDRLGNREERSLTFTLALSPLWGIGIALGLALAAFLVVLCISLLARGRNSGGLPSAPRVLDGQGPDPNRPIRVSTQPLWRNDPAEAPTPVPSAGAAFLSRVDPRTGQNQTWPLNQEITPIGRSGEESQVVLPGREISRRQAFIRCRENQFSLIPVSQNIPVFINGCEVAEEQLLLDGDQISIGSFILYFHQA
jgi:VWFA-related protein